MLFYCCFAPDNIDEMMLQFEGREEELIETLRTMQERSVAQRARAAVQKTAKLEAKAKASVSNASASSSYASSYTSSSSRSAKERGGVPGPRLGDADSFDSTEPSYYGSSSVSDYDGGDHSLDESSVSDLGMTSESDLNASMASSSKRSGKSSLELAIEKGDWRAVGEAAAMMGEGSERIIPDENDESLSSSLSESQGQQERVHYLDALIAKGDWAGIVAAAGKYQAIDDQGVGHGLPTEEEREALAKADMWQTIANQSKQNSSSDAKGAEDAADWALDRIMKGGAEASGGDPDPKKPRVADDESV